MDQKILCNHAAFFLKNLKLFTYSSNEVMSM